MTVDTVAGGAPWLVMDAPALFNRTALDKLVMQLASSRVSASRVSATRSLSDVRTEAEAEASARSVTRARPPRPRGRRPARTRPIATQQSVAAEAEASELTALLRCGDYSICVVRSDDLDRSSSSGVGSVQRERSVRRTGRPVSAPARDRVTTGVSATRTNRVASWHGHTGSRTAGSSMDAHRTVSSISAQSVAYENPPPSSSDESDSDTNSWLDSDSVFADDELTDVPHSSSAPELLAHPGWTSSQRRNFDDAQQQPSRALSRTHDARNPPHPLALSNGAWYQPSCRPSSSRPSSAACRRRRRSRKRSSDTRKARAIRRWVAADDQENVQPVARVNHSKKTPGQHVAPPRPAGPPPVRSSSAIRSRAAAEAMLAMR